MAVEWHDCNEKWSKRGDAGKICRMQWPKKVSSNHFPIGRFEDENLEKKKFRKSLQMTGVNTISSNLYGVRIQEEPVWRRTLDGTYHHFTFSTSPIRQMFEHSRMNHGFDSTNLWRRIMVWQIHDSTSNIRIFGFDRVKIPFTDLGIAAPVRVTSLVAIQYIMAISPAFTIKNYLVYFNNAFY